MTIQDIESTVEAAVKVEGDAVAALSRRNGPNISVINRSTVVTDADVIVAVQSLQVQVSRDFAPVWGLDAKLSFVPTGGIPPANQWQLVILDNADQAGALGYHDWTAEGLPIGKVFAKTDMDNKSSWTVTASHELLEMIADPDIVRCVLIDSRLYALEVADAPEDDQFGYQIGGVLVSDFCYPTWFEPSWAPNQTQFDYGKHITQPFQLLPGGYIGYLDITNSSGWQQLTLNQKPMRKARAPIGSRRERRRIPRSQWLKSGE